MYIFGLRNNTGFPRSSFFSGAICAKKLQFFFCLRVWAEEFYQSSLDFINFIIIRIETDRILFRQNSGLAHVILNSNCTVFGWIIWPTLNHKRPNKSYPSCLQRLCILLISKSCVFRSKRPANPIYAGHWFRSMSTTREKSKAGDSMINQVVSMMADFQRVPSTRGICWLFCFSHLNRSLLIWKPAGFPTDAVLWRMLSTLGIRHMIGLSFE